MCLFILKECESNLTLIILFCFLKTRYEQSSKNWTNFQLHIFTETQKSDLLSKFNTLKNRYANGDFVRKGYPKASNFSVIVSIL